MIDPKAKPKSYLRLMALVALMGIVSAVVTFAFIALVHQGKRLVWEQTRLVVGIDPRLFTILVCALGGLLVRLFGEHNAIFAELMQEFGRTGRFNYRHAPGIVITAIVSLISGASLGPRSQKITRSKHKRV
jgi:H+/Cl- antiporter ClcA